MNAHEFINYKLEFDLNNLYILIEEENISILDEKNDATKKNPLRTFTICKLVM